MAILSQSNTSYDTEFGGVREDFVDNTLCAIGLGMAGGTAIAGAALLTAALPAQMLGAVTISGGLYYAGKRQIDGKPIVPSFASDDKTTDKKSDNKQAAKAAA